MDLAGPNLYRARAGLVSVNRGLELLMPRPESREPTNRHDSRLHICQLTLADDGEWNELVCSHFSPVLSDSSVEAEPLNARSGELKTFTIDICKG